MKRKNLIAVILALILVLGLVMTMVACGPSTPTDNKKPPADKKDPPKDPTKAVLSTEVNKLVAGVDGAFKTFATAESAAYVGATVYVQVNAGAMAGLEPMDLSLELAIKACIDSTNAAKNAALIEIRDTKAENPLGVVAALYFKTEGTKEVVYFGQQILNNTFTWRKFSQVEDAKLMSKMITDLLFGKDFAKTTPVGYKMASADGLINGMVGDMLGIVGMIQNLSVFDARAYAASPKATDKKPNFAEIAGKDAFVLNIVAKEIGGLASGLGSVVDFTDLKTTLTEGGFYGIVNQAVGMILGKTYDQLFIPGTPQPTAEVYPNIAIGVGYNTDKTLAGLGIHYDYSHNPDLPIKLDIGIKDLEVLGNAKEVAPSTAQKPSTNTEEASIELSMDVTLRGASENPVAAELKAYVFPDIKLTLEDYYYDEDTYRWEYVKDASGSIIFVKDSEITKASNDIKRGTKTYKVPGIQVDEKWQADVIELPTEDFKYRVNDGFIQEYVVQKDPVPFAQFDFSGLYGFATIKAKESTADAKVFADFNVNRNEARDQSGFKLDLEPVLEIVRSEAVAEYEDNGTTLKYFIPLDIVSMWEAEFNKNTTGLSQPANAEAQGLIDEIIGFAIKEDGSFNILGVLGEVLDMTFLTRVVSTVKTIASEETTTPIKYVLAFTNDQKEISLDADLAALMTKLVGTTGKTGLIGEIKSDKVALKTYYATEISEDGILEVLATPTEKQVGEYLTAGEVLTSVASIVNLETGKRLADDVWRGANPDGTEAELAAARDAYFEGKESDWALADIPATEDIWTFEKVQSFVTNLTGITLDAQDAYADLKAKLGITFDDGATLALAISKGTAKGLDVSINIKLAGNNAEAKAAYEASAFKTPFAAETFKDTSKGAEGDTTWNGLQTILFDEMMRFVGLYKEPVVDPPVEP